MIKSAIKFVKDLFDPKDESSKSIIIDYKMDPLKIVEKLRDFGLDCIEQQYSNSPIIRGEVKFGDKVYNEFIISHRLKFKYMITVNSDKHVFINSLS